jgi:hypothetical protein
VARNQYVDAFYEDEWGTARPNGLHANKFGFAFIEDVNPLDPATRTPSVTPEVVPQICQGMKGRYSIFVPPPVLAAIEKARQEKRPLPKVKISLFFGVPGADFNMFGLRTPFAAKSDRVLIVVPGIEAGGSYCSVSSAQWGIGITRHQITMLFDYGHLKDVDWEIVTIACYSAGYMGFNGTLNNGLIPLNRVETAIIYDDLYRGDTPPPGDTTRRALAALAAARTPPANIVTYDITPGGVPSGSFNGRRAAVPSSGVISVRPRSHVLRALIHARVLDAAVKEGIVQANQLPPVVQNLRRSLPARGTIIPQSPLPYYATQPKGMTLTDWGKANAADIARLGSSPKASGFDLIDTHELVWPGWVPLPEHQLLHIGFVGEFAWEYLAGQ